MPNDPNVPWTDEQWARVNQVIHEEAGRARLAATFLPLFGPLEAQSDFVRAETIVDSSWPIRIKDRDIIQLATLQVKLLLRSSQLADPELRSALALFRRAANVLGRLEDVVVFNGLQAVSPTGGVAPPFSQLPSVWEISGGAVWEGLLAHSGSANTVLVDRPGAHPPFDPTSLVGAVSEAIGDLEHDGHFGPFAVVLGQDLFLTAQTPYKDIPVLPQDRIIPFLGGGPLLRSTVINGDVGLVLALGGAPVELVVARDVSAQFLQVTDKPEYLFRIRERMALRVKEAKAIVNIAPKEPPVLLSASPRWGYAKPSVTQDRRVTIRGLNLLDLWKPSTPSSPPTSPPSFPIRIYFGDVEATEPYYASDGLSIVVDAPPQNFTKETRVQIRVVKVISADGGGTPYKYEVPGGFTYYVD
jgi:uncharacterized linocin/CFP29 family protein